MFRIWPWLGSSPEMKEGCAMLNDESFEKHVSQGQGSKGRRENSWCEKDARGGSASHNLLWPGWRRSLCYGLSTAEVYQGKVRQRCSVLVGSNASRWRGPAFIARLVCCASEDVGLADPTALPPTVAAMQGSQLLGKPECDVLLAQAVVHLARAPKFHEVYHALGRV